MAWVLAVAVSLSCGAARADEAATPEQLLAAELHAEDVTKARLDPGGWWDDNPEFNGRLEPGASPDLRLQIVNHVFGNPEQTPSEVATVLKLYAAPDPGAAAFAASESSDRADYGDPIDGPKLGDQSRYHRIAGDHDRMPIVALRFHYKRYLALVSVGGGAAALTAEALAALAQVVIGRLDALDRNALSPPALPPLAETLPQADDRFGPMMGTAAVGAESWAWVWSEKDLSLEESAKLRRLLVNRAAQAAPVVRAYALAGSPGNQITVAVLPFANEGAAIEYLSAVKKEDSRRDAAVIDGDEIRVAAPIADVAPAYRADFRAGKALVEIACFAPFAITSRNCAQAVRDMAERVRKGLEAR
jgi:hypothetical protein